MRRISSVIVGFVTVAALVVACGKKDETPPYALGKAAKGEWQGRQLVTVCLAALAMAQTREWIPRRRRRTGRLPTSSNRTIWTLPQVRVTP